MAGEPPRPAAEPVRAGGLLRAFSCPACGGAVQLRASGHSLSVVCPSCLSVLDATDPSFKVLSEYYSKIRSEPLIPLGTRGKLRGDPWECIGFMVRSDSTGSYLWEEYLLFNPYKGYRWLVQDRGHWNFVTMIKDKPEEHPFRSTGYKYLGETFKVYHRDQAIVQFVLGEFYWRVKVGDKVRTEDSIRPPRMLSMEKDSEEVVWSLAEYLEPEAVRAAFQPPKPLPARDGIAPNQPTSSRTSLPKLWSTYMVALVVMMGIQFASGRHARNQGVLSETLSFRRGQPLTWISQPFALEGGLDNLAVRSHSAVRNTWVYLELALLGEDDRSRAYRFAHDISFYEGRDSDGYWSEGTAWQRTVLSSIPGGRYRLSVSAQLPPEAQNAEIGLEAARGVSTLGNFWFLALVLSVFPLLTMVRYHWQESRRWHDSEFNPYQGNG